MLTRLLSAVSRDDAIIMGGVVAVASVNVVSVAYIYYAYVIEDLDKEEEAKKER